MKLHIVIFFSFYLLGHLALADELRHTSFEWDPIDGATIYEIEIKQIYSLNKAKIKKNEKTNQANWKGDLPPGVYELKIRSYDQRKVAGDFSESIQLVVKLEKPKINRLKNMIQSENQDNEKINLIWQPVSHAKKYKLQIRPVVGKTIELETTDSEYKIELPVAQKYSWSVQAIAENNLLNSELNETQDFQIYGSALDEPEIEIPENEFVRQLTWKKPTYSQNHQFELLYDKDGKWESILKGETTTNKMAFSKNYPGGKYQFRLQSSANLRQASKMATAEFYVIQGDRSKTAESAANHKRAITTPDGIYVQAKYSISNLQYNNNYADQNQNTQFNAVSGIAGIGVGVTSKFSNIGYIGSIDYGTLGFNDQSIQFYNLEMNLTTHYELYKSKFKFFAGANIKQFPSIGSNQNGDLIPQNLSSYGFHLGVEYWYALTGQLGVQANLHLYELFGTIETPNREPIKPSLSTQTGIMGAYRITPMTTGFIGYMKKIDQIKYEHAYDASSTADNEIIMNGDYVSFIIESNFDETDFFVNNSLIEDKNYGFYNIARYCIANMNYVNTSTEVGTQTAFSTISGIGGIGIGFKHQNSIWGYLGFFDYGGIGYDNQNIQYGSIDLNNTIDVDLSSSQFRIIAGFAIKQLPTITKDNNGNINPKIVTGFGLHLGGEYTYSFSSTFGIQSNIHMYEILSKLSTPNEQKITPSTSSQFGIMGKYQMNSHMKGLAGITTRIDQIKFAASSNAIASDDNKVHIQGQFLNLILEMSY